ncbi:MAG TPA: hypothetical protein VHL98_07330 [Microvirga sp.]|jgi:uncharacterized protein YjiS (DUF1127 family)|nr:hypothetical protein [Microvirga sp.]
MIALSILHCARMTARILRRSARPSRPRLPHGRHRRPACAGLEGVDRHTLADIGIGRGAIVSLPRQIGADQLRRPPHL